MDYQTFTRELAIYVGERVVNEGAAFEGLSLLCFDEAGRAHWRCVIDRLRGDPDPIEFYASELDGNTVREIGARLLDRIF